MNNVGNTNLQLTNVFPGVEEEWLPQEVDTATPKGYSVRSKMQEGLPRRLFVPPEELFIPKVPTPPLLDSLCSRPCPTIAVHM